jgi:hypothetical protein
MLPRKQHIHPIIVRFEIAIFMIHKYRTGCLFGCVISVATAKPYMYPMRESIPVAKRYTPSKTELLK